MKVDRKWVDGFEMDGPHCRGILGCTSKSWLGRMMKNCGLM